MNRYTIFGLTIILIMVISIHSSFAKHQKMSVGEFINTYNTMLAGKTLITESVEDGLKTTKIRHYGQAKKLDNGNYEIPVEVIINITKDGSLDQRYTLKILDKVIDHGGVAIVVDEVVETKIEKSGLEPIVSDDEEFNGHYIVTKNDKGGFDAWSFSLVPSIVTDDKLTDFSLGGSMIHYSCYPEDGLTNCVLTIRDYKLEDYEPMVGFKKMNPHGGDLKEVAKEVKN